MPNRMDSLLSKGAGKMHGVRARLDGLVGVFQTLAEEHGEVSALLKRLQERPEKQPELWPTIRRELLSHERAEQRVVYPVLLRHPETQIFAEQHEQEATQLEAMIERLDRATIDEWPSLYNQLVDTVIHHAKEEESEIFPIARQVIGDATAKDLDDRFLAAKQQATEVV